MLLQIRDYIQSEKVVSSQQLLRTFNLDSNALEPMLDLWIKRGVIVCCNPPVTSCQSKCMTCTDSRPTYYRYCSF